MISIFSFRNVFHAAYTIASKEGGMAIQKGLVPALWYQFVMNGIRLGLFHIGESRGFTRNTKTGKVDPLRSILVASACGATGGVIGSPFCLVRINI
jgi:solute carrier family 25 protein 34/35